MVWGAFNERAVSKINFLVGKQYAQSYTNLVLSKRLCSILTQRFTLECENSSSKMQLFRLRTLQGSILYLASVLR